MCKLIVDALQRRAGDVNPLIEFRAIAELRKLTSNHVHQIAGVFMTVRSVKKQPKDTSMTATQRHRQERSPRRNRLEVKVNGKWGMVNR
jgi:hypothetical protein